MCAPRGGTNRAPVLHPTTYAYPWLEFVQATNGWAGTLHLNADSWPKTAWQIRLQQVDRAGALVLTHQEAEKTLENSGIIERIPELENLEVTFPLKLAADSGVPQGALYQISLATLWTGQGNPVRWGEAMPLALNLPTAGQSRVFNAESLTLVKSGASVQATVQAELVSWPKMRWRLALELADAGGEPVGHGEHLVENGGEIISQPAWSHPSFEFAVPGDLQALDQARRWTLRIESLPQEPPPKGP